MDKGSVIDFIKHRLAQFPQINYQKEMDGVNQVLKQFANEPIVSNSTTPRQADFKIEKKAFDRQQFTIQPLIQGSKGWNYLASRGINQPTLNVFSPSIHLIRDGNSAQDFVNVGFPYRNKYDGLVGFEVRNHKFKGHARNSDKDTGVWKVAMRPFAEQVKDVFLFESAIDAMSFYQIYHTKFNFKDAAFISFGGTLTPNQMENVIQSYQNARFYAGFDNDPNGHIYDYAFEKRLNPKLEIDVKRVGDEFLIKHKTSEHRLAYDDFSLKKAAELTGQKLSLYVAKPTQGKDFNEMLQGLNQNVKQGEGRGHKL